VRYWDDSEQQCGRVGSGYTYKGWVGGIYPGCTLPYIPRVYIAGIPS